MDSAAIFYDLISKSLDVNRIMSDLQFIGTLQRYSGSSDGEKAVDYIVEKMHAFGVDVERMRYEVYRSLPLFATVDIEDGIQLKKCKGTPYVYSGKAKNLRAQVFFDEASNRKSINAQEDPSRYDDFKGKIVLTYDSSYNFAKKAHRAGAVGVLTIWRAEIPHHGTLGGIWGNPEIEDIENGYPYIPFVELVKSDGEKLRASLAQGDVFCTLNVEMDDSIVESSMPVATIRGKSDKYVLVSGHYDSWYEGATDNGVANASMIELARVLQEHKSELRRTVVLAWWSGHSDGRYAGSTWYYDKYWKDLFENCVAHINMDICGCKGSDLVGLNTSMLEGEQFGLNFLTEFNQSEPMKPIPMARFADQTFWGANVPFTIMPKFTRRVESGEAIFDWWHTKHDALDKVDPEIVLRDIKVVAKLTASFAITDPLPADLSGFINLMEARLKTIEDALCADFDISPLYPYLLNLRRTVMSLEKTIKNRSNTDDIIIRVGGEMTRLMYSYSSRYHHDHAVEQQLFPKLSIAMGRTRENTRSDNYLALKTTFIRQRNRILGQIGYIIEMCENKMLRWQMEDKITN